MQTRERERRITGPNAGKDSAVGSKVSRPLPAERTPLQGLLGNRTVQTLFHQGSIQAKLRISQPGDADEMEADRIADEVTAIHPDHETHTPSSLPGRSPKSSPMLQRKCDCAGDTKCPKCEEEEIESAKGIHRKAGAAPAKGPGNSSVPKGFLNGLGSGRAIEPAVRKSMESRFGQDFSSVRIHDNPEAADSANAINARAYTCGTDIAFAQGQYAPKTPSGLRLLTHELVHVIQQYGRKDRVSRAPAEQYQTTGINLDPTNVTAISKGNYWVEKISRLFELHQDPRLAKDDEEKDAVLSAVLRVQPPAGFKSEVTELVTIPARKIAGSKPLLYKFKFIPASKTKRAVVEVIFVADDTAAITKPTGTAPAGFTSPGMKLSTVAFPGNDPKGYWNAHPDEQNQVFAWIQNKAPNSFDQVISTKVVTKGKKASTTRETLYKVLGSKDATGNITGLTVTFLGSPRQSTQAPDADYHSKDVMDERLEHAQSTLDPKTKDKLGTVHGISGLPKEEALSVKNAVLQYFENGTRNSEVDAIVPIPDPPKRVFYTFHFHSKAKDGSVEVDVKRIGEEGKEVKLDASRLSLSRVSNFDVLSKDIPKLKDWIHKRYPSVTIEGKDAKEICAHVDKQIRAQASTADWFVKNYGITILNAAQGAERLRKAHSKTFQADFQVSDTTNFTPEELITLESVLETMSDGIIASYKDLKMVRKQKEIDAVKKGKKFVPKIKEDQDAGLSLEEGTERTVIIFDRSHIEDQALFMGGSVGGRTRVESSAAGTFAHELGHIESYVSPSAKVAFDAMVKKEKIETFTWYAASKPASEFFAESFMLFQLDPEWLAANSPKIFNFFDVLSKTGSPPKAGSTP